MSDAISLCNRCNKPLNDNVLAIALNKELSDLCPREVQLCQSCVASFERWFSKRSRSSSRSADGGRSESSATSRLSFGSKRSERRPKAKKEIYKRLLYTSLTILVFFMVFCWTWTILKTAAARGE
jgi:hypothetical protein